MESFANVRKRIRVATSLLACLCQALAFRPYSAFSSDCDDILRRDLVRFLRGKAVNDNAFIEPPRHFAPFNERDLLTVWVGKRKLLGTVLRFERDPSVLSIDKVSGRRKEANVVVFRTTAGSEIRIPVSEVRSVRKGDVADILKNVDPGVSMVFSQGLQLFYGEYKRVNSKGEMLLQNRKNRWPEAIRVSDLMSRHIVLTDDKSVHLWAEQLVGAEKGFVESASRITDELESFHAEYKKHPQSDADVRRAFEDRRDRLNAEFLRITDEYRSELNELMQRRLASTREPDMRETYKRIYQETVDAHLRRVTQRHADRMETRYSTAPNRTRKSLDSRRVDQIESTVIIVIAVGGVLGLASLNWGREEPDSP